MSFFRRPADTQSLLAKPAIEVLPKKPLTLLGTLLPEDIYRMPIREESVFPKGSDQPAMRKIMGQYEAALAQAAYFSRLIYGAVNHTLLALPLINTNPLVFNTGLSAIRQVGSYKQVSRVPVQPFMGIGCKLNHDDTPCYMQILDYTNMPSGCPYPGEKILYIVFRGTSTISSAIEDVKIIPRRFSDAFDEPRIGEITGAEVFAEENKVDRKGASVNPIHPFGAHRGFVSNMKGILPMICDALNTTFLNEKVDKIIITGHSLGAANATVAALLLGGFRRQGAFQKNGWNNPTIHCITFGGPKLLTDYSRNVFNSLLLEGHLTLDRVANRVRYLLEPGFMPGAKVNLVTVIPPQFDHPGFSPLKTEISKSLTATGRTKNISELRKLFAGIRRKKSMFGSTFGDGEHFNGIPIYKEFLACFDPLMNTKYDLILKNPYGTIYSYTTTTGFFQSIKSNKAEFNEIRDFVSKRLGFPIPETLNPAQDAELAAEESAEIVSAQPDVPTPKDELAAAAAAAADEDPAAPAPPKGGRRTRRRNQNGGDKYKNNAGDYTSTYKRLSMANGSNQVVYMPQYNISGKSAHVSYCGVSYWGMLANLKDALLGRSTESFMFVIQDGYMSLQPIRAPTTYTSNATGTAAGGGTMKRRAPRARKTCRRL